MLPLTAGDTADQLSGIAGWMTTLIDALGPIGVGIVILIETVFPPIPSEVVLPAAGYLAGIGQLSWWSTLVWATIGSVVGAWTLYGVGALVGADRIGRLAARLPSCPNATSSGLGRRSIAGVARSCSGDD